MKIGTMTLNDVRATYREGYKVVVTPMCCFTDGGDATAILVNVHKTALAAARTAHVFNGPLSVRQGIRARVISPTGEDVTEDAFRQLWEHRS